MLQGEFRISVPANENSTVLKHRSLSDDRTECPVSSAPLFLGDQLTSEL